MQTFIDGVMDDSIVSCKAIRGAVERHLRDIDRQGTPAFPYQFDHVRASIACDFFPLCLRHSIGNFAGLPFELEAWQVFGVASIFGWVRMDDNSRRFRKAYWSMARKNGKSSLGAGLALYLASLDVNPVTMLPESVAEIIFAATKREQVEKIMFAEALRMRMQSKVIESKSEVVNKVLTFYHNSGSIRCVGSDKPYSGLNPSGVFLDEVHEFSEYHRKFYDTILTGSATRSQPIAITFTTAGDDKSYIWLDEYRHAVKVATGEYQDEALFALTFEIDQEDDALDEAVWAKANPNLGVCFEPQVLREEAARVGVSRIAKNRFTRFFTNRLVTSTEAAFDIWAWDQCAGELSDWNEADAIGCGVDLGGRDDFAAWGVVARFQDGTFEVDERGEKVEKPRYRYELEAFVYIAEDTERDLTQAPFVQWIAEGRINVCKYPINDMKADLLLRSEQIEIEDVAYDPHGGQMFAEDLEQEGLLCARMSQTYGMFHEPISDFHQAMTDGRLRHNGCPVLRWCVGNAVACRDRQERWMLDKKSSIDKIDPVVAVVMAYRRAMVAGGRATDEDLIIV